MDNAFIELIKTRRSCRKYTSEQVTDEQLATVMEAGTYAPTAHGQQDPIIVAVQRPDVMQRLIAMNAAVRGVGGNPYYDAPTVVLVFASESNANAFQDGSCVLQNMMLAAHALGLATCWINREYEMFSTEEGQKLMRELGLPEGLKGIGAISLGHAAAPASAPKPRKEGWTRVIK
jgi:nitroreductase